MSQTYQPKKKKRARTHGFLVRQASPGGRSILRRRRQRGRKRLAVQPKHKR
ncbi:MAG: 50S ribosomal protein L34 [Candidatus Colwellbacteria bacterium RIFCSPLOWO2_01_FULL_48_10]|uniref:Large ribosomal subunit protein bL34 n=1 Tax=Candidatus Colwellbacteria bacterium RIFCSPLOWO2_01_FULL_48_10 TaxID=1797690 RepID=A0A1G1Z3Y6_9BACT|nr:MAG: 50S ribosomal protein L34 [Candidatus Colwellbacteria bacterium RIFCSPLOWO2_01_FULL_48_10]